MVSIGGGEKRPDGGCVMIFFEVWMAGLNVNEVVV